MVVILPYCIKAKRCEHNALGYWSGLAVEHAVLRQLLFIFKSVILPSSSPRWIVMVQYQLDPSTCSRDIDLQKLKPKTLAQNF